VSAAARLAAFAAGVALLSGGAAAAGGAIDPKGADDGAPHEDMTSTTPTSHSGSHSQPAAKNGEHGTADPVRGLAVADDGLRVELATPELPRGRDAELRYRIVNSRGRPVRDFEVEHERRMHLIVVRRDLTGFQHLHPRLDEDGSWSTRVRLNDAGSYRVFADFARGGESHTLAADLRVDGAADLQDLPEPGLTARTDSGYDVSVDEHGDELSFHISRGGAPVQVEPYLGAGGHLVALREGDLAFLHVHPTGDGTDFAVEFPTPGRYRLFLQFKHEGRVHTAAFTREVK
jgi:hypothetical protein